MVFLIPRGAICFIQFEPAKIVTPAQELVKLRTDGRIALCRGFNGRRISPFDNIKPRRFG